METKKLEKAQQIQLAALEKEKAEKQKLIDEMNELKGVKKEKNNSPK